MAKGKLKMAGPDDPIFQEGYRVTSARHTPEPVEDLPQDDHTEESLSLASAMERQLMEEVRRNRECYMREHGLEDDSDE